MKEERIQASDISAFRRYLARKDEFLKSYKFINVAAKLYPELKEDAELAFKQVAHVFDPNLYKSFYTKNITENPWPEDTIFNDGNFPDRLRWVKRILKEQNCKTIVDLGCGSGEIPLNLAKDGYKVTGVNLFKKSIEYATDIAKSRNLPARFVEGDALEFSEGTYDAVLAFEMIEHVPNDKKLVERMFNLTNNIICLTTPDKTADEQATAVGVDLENAVGHEFKGHVRAYNKETFLDLFKGKEIIDLYRSETDRLKLLHVAVRR